MQSRRINRRARRGFSLLEMMLVVVIIGILMTVVVLNLGGAIFKTKGAATRAKLLQIKGALVQYSGEYGSMPPTELGLMPLVTTKSLEVVPLDSWKRAFFYRFPGQSGNPDWPFDLYSLGEDGVEGTPDDINVWTIDTR